MSCCNGVMVNIFTCDELMRDTSEREVLARAKAPLTEQVWGKYYRTDKDCRTVVRENDALNKK